jgi:tRNA A-37 threonylcarbamoyl transferase component Bud32
VSFVAAPAALRGPPWAGTPGEVAGRIASLAPVSVLARSRTTETAVVDLPGLGRAVRKRWWWPRAADRAKGAFRTTVAARSPARREMEALLRLRRLPSGPCAPAPLAIVEERRAGVLQACALLLEEVAGATDLATFLRDERDAARRAAVLFDLAARVREMHAAGLVDRDLHPRNVLVAGVRTWKVDSPKQRAGREPARPADVLADLAALDVGLVRLASPAERAAFVAGALGAAPDRATLARLDAARARIDERESRRLPPASTEVPPDNGR